MSIKVSCYLRIASNRRYFVIVEAESSKVLRDGRHGCENGCCITQDSDELFSQRQHRLRIGRVQRIQPTLQPVSNAFLSTKTRTETNQQRHEKYAKLKYMLIPVAEISALIFISHMSQCFLLSIGQQKGRPARKISCFNNSKSGDPGLIWISSGRVARKQQNSKVVVKVS